MSAYDPVAKVFAPHVKLTAGDLNAFKIDIYAQIGSGAPYVLPTASTVILGGVKVDGTSIAVSTAGVISAIGGGGSSYVLPPASSSTLGGVKQGSGVTIASDGTLTVATGTSYTLPAATASSLGGIKVGTGLAVAGDGTLSATASGGAAYTGTAPIVVSGTTISLTLGTGANTAAAGNDSRIVGALPTAGGAMTGALTLAADPTTALGAVTKQYVDNAKTAPLTVKTIDGVNTVASTSAPYQMVATDRFIDVVNTSNAAIKLLLPTAPTLAVEYTIIDGSRTAGTYNIAVTGASGVTINGAATLTLTQNADAFSLRAVNATTWRIA